MEEQLISFETAKLTKEKGFPVKDGDLGYFYVYNKREKEFEFSTDAEIINFTVDSYLPAPTQSLLQKWLREKRQIHIEIYSNHSGWGWILTEINGTTIKEIKDDIFFKNFEEALEIGLEKALNLLL
jgi:hypothetical protein